MSKDTSINPRPNQTTATSIRGLAPTADQLTAERIHGYPIWVRPPKSGTCHWTGLSRSALYALATQGLIRTASIRKSGQTKGTRLFHVPSVLALIEEHATGPDGSTPTPRGEAKGSGMTPTDEVSHD